MENGGIRREDGRIRREDEVSGKIRMIDEDRERKMGE